MKLFIVALKGIEHSVMPQCAKDAIACARLFSGMEVIGLSDFEEEGWLDSKPYASRADDFRRDFITACGMEPRNIPCSLQWFIIDDYIRVHSLNEPIFRIDWECMVFGNLDTHFRKLSVTSGDLGDCVDKKYPPPLGRMSPNWIGNLSSIRFFTSMLEAQVKCKTPLFTGHKNASDMSWWQHTRSQGGYTPVDISTEINGAVFDGNMMLGCETYQSSGGYKQVFWKDGKPYFKRISDGVSVKAVALHCFFLWRVKTSDILLKATTGYSD